MNYIYRFLALLIFLGLLPLIIISCLAILIEDGYPFLFFQDRLGINKKVFKIIKLRTMKKSTPNMGTHLVDVDSYLITGKFMRKLKIDELPQLINLIKGDLNIIGPRPGLPNQYELMTEREKLSIFSIKPGISGLAQINGYDMSDPVSLAKVDKIYINNADWMLDFRIIIATIFSPLRNRLKKDFLENV